MRKRLAVVVPAAVLAAGLFIYFAFARYNVLAGRTVESYKQELANSLTKIENAVKANGKTNGSSEVNKASGTGGLPSDAAGSPGTYVVKAADTLQGVAARFKVTASELKWTNGLKSDTLTPGQSLKIPEKQDKPLRDIMKDKEINTSNVKIRIVVDKSDKVLGLFAGDTYLKSYHVEMGDKGIGDKEVEGDHKTPEGNFYITERTKMNPADEYLGTRWLRLSYPNIEDAERGLKEGIIGMYDYNAIVSAIKEGRTPPQETPLGGAVGIHGGSSPKLGSDWTWGCVGLTSSNIEEFYGFIGIGTQVLIQK